MITDGGRGGEGEEQEREGEGERKTNKQKILKRPCFEEEKLFLFLRERILNLESPKKDFFSEPLGFPNGSETLPPDF